MNIGDRVYYNNKLATLINEVRPKCRCKGKGHYELRMEESNDMVKVPITTILEPYKPLEMARPHLTPFKLT